MEQFNDPQFSVIALTAALNSLGYTPGQLGALNIFEEDGVAVTLVEIEEESGTLQIIEPTARGGPGNTTDDTTRQKIPFAMDHFEINDSVKADEVQGVRQLGSNDQLETIQARVDSKQARHARSFDTTLEHLRVGAIKGIVTSGKGTALHDLYTRFGMAVPAAIDLGTGAGDVADLGKQLDGVVHAVEDDLDEAYERLHAMTGNAFHSAMWEQKAVRETFLNVNGAEILRQGVPDVFKFGKITFERYRTGKKATAANSGAGFIGDGEARLFAVGVPDLFITRFGPADYEETVNTIGLPRYSRQYPMPNGKGRHLDATMDVINICTRPQHLRKLTTA